MRRRASLTYLAAGALALPGLLWYAARRDEQPAHLKGATMGTRWSIRLYTEPAAFPMVRRTIQDIFDGVDKRMSTYRHDSELTGLNRAPADIPLPIHPDTAQILAEGLKVSSRSGGVFDATVAPLVDAWGFGPMAGAMVPPEAMLATLAQRVGFGKVELDIEQGWLTKAHPDVQLDCSGIAKGFAVDAVARVLIGLGLAHFIIEAGGEIRAVGCHADGRPWTVGVERPVARGARRVYRPLTLGNNAVATSGTYRNYFEADGKRYSHTLDPRTARPVAHRLASVTVVAKTAVQADAWSTALLVAGEKHGLALAEQLGLAAYFIAVGEDATEHEASEGSGFEDRWTSAMAAYL